MQTLRVHPGACEGGAWRCRSPFLHLSQASSLVSRSLNIIHLCLFRVRGSTVAGDGSVICKIIIASQLMRGKHPGVSPAK